MNNTVSKGNANKETLADRMKRYEEVTTNTSLMERVPIYARIDMRAGHSWCKHLNKPFDDDYANAMKYATSYMVEKTGAILGFCQSDECSLCWVDSSKIPFETRLFKLQSVLASMFTSAFIKACINTKLEDKISSGILPSFDCRVINLPNMDELANMILWRSNDSMKNSITLLALEHFSTNEIHKKNGSDKIKMLMERGIDYYTNLTEEQRIGAFFRRELYKKELSEDELERIPQNNLPLQDEDGKYRVIRSHIVQFNIGNELSMIENRKDVLFNHSEPILKYGLTK